MSPLSDGVLRLRLLVPQDAQDLLAGEDETARTWLRHGRTIGYEDTQPMAKKSQAGWWAGHDLRLLGPEELSTQRLVGMVMTGSGLSALNMKPGDINVAYQVFPESRGKGYGTRALLLAHRMHQEIAVGTWAVVTIHPENIASLRVALKAGFVPDGQVWIYAGRQLTQLRRELIEEQASYCPA